MRWNVRARLMGIVVMAGMFVLILGGRASAKDPVAAKAFVDVEPLVAGGTGRIAVEIGIDPRFHVQSSRPHDPHLIATRVAFKDSAGIAAGAPLYPAGRDISGGPLAGDVKISAYVGKVYVVLPIRVAGDAAPGPRTLSISLTTQACEGEQCLEPRTQALNVPVTIAAAGTAVAAQNADVFAAADRQAFEAPATEAAADGATKAGPATTASTATTAATMASGGGSVSAGATEIPLLSDQAELALIQSRGYRPYNPDEYSPAVILLLALLGGVILNVMPCVLPVIPLKVLSLVQQAHGDRRVALLHGLTFSAGIITLFIGLAIVLKTAGLFYGQQFQSPGFLIVMFLFVVALALSMLGVWTINPPQALYAVEGKAPHTGYLGSFSNGLMATLLATPCSAPFLGAVLAWALKESGWMTGFMLGLVGVGMSLPYLVLAVFPGMLSRVPRAGRWSDLLKQGLGIVMIGVAVYLLTLISNATLWPWVLAGGVVVGLVCWAWGQIPSFNMERGRIWGIRIGAVAVGTVMGVALYVLGARFSVAGQIQRGEENGWKPFNIALLDDALAHHRPVVVDWTASWCINCHFLEAAVLDTDPVEKAFQDGNALLLRADLSSDNPPATLLNHELGGEAIPVLAIFSPSRPLEPVVLRDIYSKDRLIGEVRKAQ